MSNPYNEFNDIFGSSSQDIMYFMEESGMLILGVLGGVLLIALLISILTYVLTSLGIYTIAKRRGIQNPWLAWIPVADYWTLGCISDQYQYVVMGKVRNKRKTLLILAIAPFVLSFISNIVTVMAFLGASEPLGVTAMLGSLLVYLINIGLSIALLIVYYCTLNDIYHSCTPWNSTTFLVLSIIFSFLVPYFLFFLRKKDGGMPPRQETVYQPAPQAPVFNPPVEESSSTPAQEPPAGHSEQEYL